MRNPQTMTRIDLNIYPTLQDLATERGCSVAKYINLVLMAHIEQKPLTLPLRIPQDDLDASLAGEQNSIQYTDEPDDVAEDLETAEPVPVEDDVPPAKRPLPPEPRYYQ
jgi:hypothetical protein